MKKKSTVLIVTGLTLIHILTGCSKSSSAPEPQPETTLKFKVNGTAYEWRHKGFCGLYCGTSINKYPDHYVLVSIDPQSYSNQLSLTMQTTGLSATTYNHTVASPVTSSNAINGLYLYNPVSGGSYSFAASTEIGDFANITITIIHDGKYADGTFTTRLTLSPYGANAGKVDITEGEFHNVIIYQ
jgi:hypothetical protein